MSYKIRHLGVPKKFYLAISGGVDSMVAWHHLSSLGLDITPINFNHGTEFGSYALNDFLIPFFKERGVDLVYGEASSIGKNEAEWKTMRDEFFSKRVGKEWLIQAHHINDAIEWYILTALKRYEGQTMPLFTDKGVKCYRPFLLSSKTDMYNYAEEYGVSFLEDPSNKDTKFLRNRIRHGPLMREWLEINPGLIKRLKNKYLQQYRDIKFLIKE